MEGGKNIIDHCICLLALLCLVPVYPKEMGTIMEDNQSQSNLVVDEQLLFFSNRLISCSAPIFCLDFELEIFFEATEDWNSAMAISNSMAFISQFGEVCRRKRVSSNPSSTICLDCHFLSRAHFVFLICS